MNHLKLSSLFIFTVCALVVVTMALPVYRAYAPAIKAPEARPPKPPITTEPRPGEDQCRARLLALANETREFLQQHGRLPWNTEELSTPLICPESGEEYCWLLFEISPYRLEQLRAINSPLLGEWQRVMLRNFLHTPTNPIACCMVHIYPESIVDWVWNNSPEDPGWCPVIIPVNNQANLGVTLNGRVAYDNGRAGWRSEEAESEIARLRDAFVNLYLELDSRR
jgi:hypothetical protein